MRRILALLILTTLTACNPETITSAEPQPLLVDAGAPPRLRASWPLAHGSAMRVEDGRLWLDPGGEEWLVAEDVIGRPTANEAGTRFAYCRQADGEGLSSVEVWDRREDGSWDGPRVIDDHADRPAVSPDGEWVAFVSGRTGIASIWLAPFEGGEALQLTNEGIEDRKVPGRPPEGFVAPPHEGPPRFEGDALVWDAPDGPHRVELP